MFSSYQTNFPRAIVHIDGDSFFASCEQSRDLSLKGRAVVTGMERGIASSMSLEAKALGITRAMPIFEIKKRFPQVIVIPSDYETYALLSARFMDIVRRYTPDIEEYGIDECFADLTGLRKLHRTSYGNICRKIQTDLERELNCTFSFGLASSKTLAKVGSKWKKSGSRSGLTIIGNKDIPQYLGKIPVGDIWNIGPQTTAFLQKNGVRSALDFASRDESWVTSRLSRNFVQTWRELRGEDPGVLQLEARANSHSIQRTRTFTPPSSERTYILARLIENLEIACTRARRFHCEAQEISFFLKTQSFHYSGMRIRLSRPSAFPHEILTALEPIFDEVYRSDVPYRATGLTLSNLSVIQNSQMDLFGSHLRIEKMGRVYHSVDEIGAKYGKGTIHMGTSFLQTRRPSDNDPIRLRDKFVVNKRQHKLGYPLLVSTDNADIQI